MFAYLIRRLILMVPTMIGITLVCFVIINLAPGSPIEQKLQAIRYSGGESTGAQSSTNMSVSNEVIEAMKKQYGFDRPILERYGIWLANIARLDFGESFTFEEPVLDVIVSKFPVSLQFGIASFLITYLVCIPLGVFQAVRIGSRVEALISFLLLVLYSVPSVMLAILLIVFFAGGSFLQWFPVGELYSDNYDSLSFGNQIKDRIHHFILPLLCYLLGGFTVLTKLMRDSMLEVIHLDYIRTARAKGLAENVVVFKHALRNALIPIATGFSSFLGVFFAGSLIIEQIFQLDGMGLLGYKALLSRDYNLLMGLIFIQAMLLLFGRLLSDLLYVWIDPRIDFR